MKGVSDECDSICNENVHEDIQLEGKSRIILKVTCLRNDIEKKKKYEKKYSHRWKVHEILKKMSKHRTKNLINKLSIISYKIGYYVDEIRSRS